MPFIKRHGKWLKLGSLAVILISLLLIMRHLPVSAMTDHLRDWLDSLGIWGFFAFVGIYMVATIGMVPGSPLTLAAGAIFGPWLGLLAVSMGSTIGAALAFLLARYVARQSVRKQAERYQKFDAIDRAVSEGGWKIVAMLRLSPAIPFNLQNYFYGLTGISFWPYVLASWLFMLPGTFMYVYFGYAAAEGLEAAAEGGGFDWRRMAMIVVGLIATVAVTIYITKLAKRKLDEQTSLDEEEIEEEDAAAESEEEGSVKGTILVLMLALAAIAGTIYVQFHPQAITNALIGLFGTPDVQMQEAYERKPEGPAIDHSTFTQVLQAHVQEGGWVDYQALADSPEHLDAYIETLSDAPFDKLGRDEKLALLINAYNAFTLRLILDYWPVDSIRDIPASERWEDERWQVGSHTWSLNQIEHEQIRPKFKEPRIHWALVCAAYSCPPLRREAYTGAELETQLETQTEYVHRHPRWFRYDPEAQIVHLTEIYRWYRGDFQQTAGGILEHAAEVAPQLAENLNDPPGIQWIPYDWSLNSMKQASSDDQETP